MKGNARRFVALTSLGLLGALSVAACGDDAGTGGQGASGGSTTSSTTSSTTGQGGAGGDSSTSTRMDVPPSCDPLELVGSQSIDPGCGVFVDVMAPDGGDGTQNNPFNSLADAIAEAEMQIPTRNVYVCAATQPVNEAILLDDKEYLVGGVDCMTWQASGEKTEWTEMSGAVPLTLQGTDNAHVQGFKITAQANLGFDGATLQGNSSIGVIVNGGMATFKEVEIIAGAAGNGGDGMDQTGQAPGRDDFPTDFNGNPGGGCGMAPGADQTYSCPGGATTVGGGGGAGGVNAGATAFDGSPDLSVPSGKGGFGEPASGGWSCNSNSGNGTFGLDGASGNAGGAGIAASGTISASGYVGNNGSVGGNGQPGEGGGGGGGRRGDGDNGCGALVAGPSGGSGGAGGCGGLAGGGGGAGGASIALLMMNAALTLTNVSLSAGAGGDGGDGGDGQGGGQGGNGANGGGNACTGGEGGDGGAGGPGGGGAGGPSLGIAYTGTMPDLGSTTITTAGTPAAGGVGGSGGNNGEAGLVEQTHAY